MKELSTVITILLQVMGVGVLIIFGLVLLAVLAFLVAGVYRYFKDDDKDGESNGVDT